MSVASDAGRADDREDAAATHEPLARDKIFHILQTQRRRAALQYLKDRDGPVEMRDLAEQVAAWEHDTTVRGLSSDERQRVYIALYQSHLPKLNEEGVIDYDQSRGVVDRGPLAAQFDPYLDATDDEDDEPAASETPWATYYRSTTAASALLVGAAWLGTSPVALVPAEAWGAVIVAAFTLLSGAQFVQERRA